MTDIETLIIAAQASLVDRLTHGVILLGEVAGALAALLGLAALVWRVLRYLARMQDTLSTVERRTVELEHNGGGSIKDVSAQTCARLGALEGAVVGVRLEVATVRERLDRHLGGGG